jgi:hypothetical protein
MPIETFRVQRSDQYAADTVDATVSARDYKSATDLIAFDWRASMTSERSRPFRSGDYAGTLQSGKQDAIYYSHDYNQDRIYGVDGVAPAHTAQDSNGARNIYTSGAVRRLTPTECERLQGFPAQAQCVTMDVCIDPLKNSAYAAIRSLKSPRLAGAAKNVALYESAKSAAKNLSLSNPNTKEPVPNVVHIFCGERTVEIHNLGRCCLSASFAENRSLFHPLTQNEDFALLVAGLNTIAARIIHTGRAGSLASDLGLILALNGESPLEKYGSEMTPLVNAAELDSTTRKGHLKSIISDPSATLISEPILTTLYSYVFNAISGYIPGETLSANTFSIELHSLFGWTFSQSDEQRYKQCGNAVTVAVAEWIGRRIMTYLRNQSPSLINEHNIWEMAK